MVEIKNAETLDRLIELGGKFAAQSPGENGVPFVLIPDRMKLESLVGLLPPSRIDRRVTLLEAGSFADYVNSFKSENTLIFAAVTEFGVTFTAILDYHEKAPALKAAYCKHVAVFAAIETPEWKVWKEANRKKMGQVEFAEWLEDNSKLLVDPNAAELLELVRTLHGHNNARFNTALRLDNGSFSVSYDEDVVVQGTNSTKGGSFALPPVIKAGIRVFQGAEAYEVSARLKSRVTERQLFLFFETISMPEIIRESILLLTKQISEKTAIIPLIGNP